MEATEAVPIRSAVLHTEEFYQDSKVLYSVFLGFVLLVCARSPFLPSIDGFSTSANHSDLHSNVQLALSDL